MVKLIFLRIFLSVFMLGGVLVSAETVAPFDAEIKTMGGKVLKLSDFKGNKPVYLKFWASWCRPCRKQMPHLQQTFEKYGSEIAVIAVNIDMNDSEAAIKQTVEEFSLSMPMAIDKDSSWSQAFNLIATPYHILLDIDGNVVHKGHDASVQLDDKIRRLANYKDLKLPEVKLQQSEEASPLNLNLPNAGFDNKKISLLYFSSTWCDWYLKDSRPAMSINCISAQKQVNDLYVRYPQFNWQGVMTRLWTGNKELKTYQKKYKIKYSLAVDKTNATFLRYRVKAFPVLIVLKNGKQIFRLDDFSDPVELSRHFKILENL